MPDEEPVPHQLVRGSARGEATKLVPATEELDSEARRRGKLEKRTAEGDSDSERVKRNRSVAAEAILQLGKTEEPEEPRKEKRKKEETEKFRASKGSRTLSGLPMEEEPTPQQLMRNEPQYQEEAMSEEPTPHLLVHNAPHYQDEVMGAAPEEEPVPHPLMHSEGIRRANEELRKHTKEIVAKADQRAKARAERKKSHKTEKSLLENIPPAPAPMTAEQAAALGSMSLPAAPAILRQHTYQELARDVDDPARVAARQRLQEKEEEEEQRKYANHLRALAVEKIADQAERRRDRREKEAMKVPKAPPPALPVVPGKPLVPGFYAGTIHAASRGRPVPDVNMGAIPDEEPNPAPNAAPAIDRSDAFRKELEEKAERLRGATQNEIDRSRHLLLNDPNDDIDRGDGNVIPELPDVTQAALPPPPTIPKKPQLPVVPVIKPEVPVIKGKKSAVKAALKREQRAISRPHYTPSSYSGGYIPVDWAAQQRKLDQRYAELRGAVPPGEPPGSGPDPPAQVISAPTPQTQYMYGGGDLLRQPPPRLVILGNMGGVGHMCNCMPEEPTPRAVTITKTY
jgi:hypothetical protein